MGVQLRRGGITNHHLIAYSLSDISAKNYQNRLVCFEDIVFNISVVFGDRVYFPFRCIRVYNLYSFLSMALSELKTTVLEFFVNSLKIMRP